MTKTEKKLKAQVDEANKYVAKVKKSGRELTDDEAFNLSYAGCPTIEDLFFGKEELVEEQKEKFRKKKVNRFSQAVFFRFQEKVLAKYGEVRIKLSMLSYEELLELSSILPSVKLNNLQRLIITELYDRLQRKKTQKMFDRWERQRKKKESEMTEEDKKLQDVVRDNWNQIKKQRAAA